MRKVETLIVLVILVVPVCTALANSGPVEIPTAACSDLSDLSPSEQRRVPVPYYCQVIDHSEPIPQSYEPPDGALTLDWLSSVGIVLPIPSV